jgi:hypothetical protein
VGLGGLGLILLAFVSWRRARRDLRLLAGVGAVGLWLAFGPLFSASHLTFHIPGLGEMRRPARYDILFILALAAFSGQGFRFFMAGRGGVLAKRIMTKRILTALAILHTLSAGLLILIACPVLGYWFWHALIAAIHPASFAEGTKNPIPKLLTLSRDLSHDFLWMAAALGLVALVISGVSFKRQNRLHAALPTRVSWTPFLFILLVASMVRLHWVHFHPFPSDFYAKPPTTLAALDLPNKSLWRVTHYLEYPGDAMWLMHHNPVSHMDLYEREKAALSFGIHAIFGIRHASAHLPLLWHWSHPLRPAELSARYLLSDLDFNTYLGSPTVKLGQYGNMYVYELLDYAPRLEWLPHENPSEAFLKPGLTVFEPRDGSLELSGNFNPGDTLIFREHFWPGWQARMDGGKWQPMIRDAVGFQFWVVDQAGSKIEIVFFPRGFFALCVACAVGFMGMAGISRVFLRRSKV